MCGYDRRGADDEGHADDLLGPDRWERRTGYGSFPIRFPSEQDPGDAGWHIDGSFEGSNEPPPWSYYVNFWSKGRALLLLMIFSGVGSNDAPTRIRVGSHADVAMALVGHGPVGVSFAAAATAASEAAGERPVIEATGRAGDVYLCHPFLVHTATWPHRGTSPRFIGQPAIFHATGHDGFDYGHAAPSAPERAVRRTMSDAGLPCPPTEELWFRVRS